MTTQAEFALKWGVSRKTVTVWCQRGIVILRPDKTVDVTASEAKLNARPEVYRGGVKHGVKLSKSSPCQTRRDSEDESSLAEALRRKELATAKLRELELAEKEGRLLPTDQVTDAWVKIATVMRTRLLTIPSKLAPRLVGMKRAADFKEAIETEIREVLQELADTKVVAARAKGKRGASHVGGIVQGEKH